MALLKPDGTKTKPKKIREIDNDLVLAEIGFAEEETDEPELEFTGEIVSDLSSEELEGKRVDVVDSKGEIISSAYVDANGQFKFEKLPPDTDFTFRLQDAPEDAQMALLKPDGTKTKPKKIREIDNDLVLAEIGFAEEETDEPELEFTGEIVSDLSSEELEGKRVDVVDSQGKVISSTYVDANGQFKFEKLPPDTDFTFRLQDAPEDAQMALLKPDGTKTKPKKIREIDNNLVLEAIDFEEEFTDEPEVEIAGRIVAMGAAQNLDGKRIDIVDASGEVLFSAFLDGTGFFRFTNLPPDENYLFRVNALDAAMTIAFMEDNGRLGPAEPLTTGTSLALKQEPAFNLPSFITPTLPDRFSLRGSVEITKLTQADQDGLVVYLVNQSSEFTHSCATKGTGRFAFLNLAPQETYYLWLNRVDPAMQLTVADGLGGKQQLKRNAAGYFEYTIPSVKAGSMSIRTEENLHVPIEVDKTYTIPNILYAFNEARHSIRQNTVLNELARVLNENADMQVQLTGHTDQIGPENYNLWLSQARAKSAKLYLMQRGVAAKRIAIIGLGESQPLVDCATARCPKSEHAKNRRTEFRVVRKTQ